LEYCSYCQKACGHSIRVCPKLAKKRPPPPPPRERREDRLKQVACKFFLDGRCEKGDACPFAHQGEQVRKQDLCKYFLVGKCSKGAACLYSHDPGAFPCRFFFTVGCDRDGCTFSHASLTPDAATWLRGDIEELARAKQQVLGTALPTPALAADEREAQADLLLTQSLEYFRAGDAAAATQAETGRSPAEAHEETGDEGDEAWPPALPAGATIAALLLKAVPVPDLFGASAPVTEPKGSDAVPPALGGSEPTAVVSTPATRVHRAAQRFRQRSGISSTSFTAGAHGPSFPREEMTALLQAVGGKRDAPPPGPGLGEGLAEPRQD
jgi:hypothetical protein